MRAVTSAGRSAGMSLVWARIDARLCPPEPAWISDRSRPGVLRIGFLPITRFTLWLGP